MLFPQASNRCGLLHDCAVSFSFSGWAGPRGRFLWRMLGPQPEPWTRTNNAPLCFSPVSANPEMRNRIRHSMAHRQLFQRSPDILVKPSLRSENWIIRSHRPFFALDRCNGLTFMAVKGRVRDRLSDPLRSFVLPWSWRYSLGRGRKFATVAL